MKHSLEILKTLAELNKHIRVDVVASLVPETPELLVTHFRKRANRIQDLNLELSNDHA